MTATAHAQSQKLLTYEAYMEEFRTQAPTPQPCEILDGVRIMPPAPRPIHQIILENLIELFRNARRAGLPIRTLPSPIDVLIQRSPLRVRQPDLLAMSAAHCPSRAVLDLPAPLTTPPELVVEILSPSETRRSVDTKIADFQAIGVLECWIVTIAPDTVEVLALTDTGYQPAAFYTPGQDLRSLVFPNLVLPVAAIFEA